MRVPLLSRCAPFRGLVHLRQRFARRGQARGLDQCAGPPNDPKVEFDGVLSSGPTAALRIRFKSMEDRVLKWRRYPQLTRRLSGPTFACVRECAYLFETKQPRDLGYTELAVVEVPNR